MSAKDIFHAACPERKIAGPGPNGERPVDLTREGFMYKRCSRNLMRYAVLILIGLAVAGCEKVPQGFNTQPAIPAALGDFVGVTTDEGERTAVLWFKQSDQTIVAYRVHVPQGVTRFPRS
jgi:hypothetical protein